MNAALWAELALSSEGMEKLHALAALVGKWTARINLVAPSTLLDLWARHIEDSARLLPLAPPNPRLWADLGAGGGFPGLVVAIVLADRKTGTRVVLVESDQRKAALLREALRQLDVPGEVIAERIETLPPLGADVISARALAPLDILCRFSERHLAPGGLSLFPKGRNWQQEVEAARRNWAFDLDVRGDPGHNAGVVLALENLQRAGDEDER